MQDTHIGRTTDEDRAGHQPRAVADSPDIAHAEPDERSYEIVLRHTLRIEMGCLPVFIGTLILIFFLMLFISVLISSMMEIFTPFS